MVNQDQDEEVEVRSQWNGGSKTPGIILTALLIAAGVAWGYHTLSAPEPKPQPAPIAAATPPPFPLPTPTNSAKPDKKAAPAHKTTAHKAPAKHHKK